MRTSPGQLTRFVAVALCACFAMAYTPTAAAGIESVTITGDVAEIEIEVGLLAADLTLTFEDATGLTEANLGLDAAATSTLDTTLLSRLPSAVALATGLLLSVEIEPPSSGGLSFDGPVEIELHTHDLEYVSGTKLRLFAAPLGGAFHDVTTWVGSGSYRVRGSKGEFSEFLVLVDNRTVDTVIATKFDRLWALLDDHESAIAADVHADLEDLLADAEENYDEDNLSGAIGHLDDFNDKVVANSGDDVPDTWRSARDLDNVAGLLRAAAATLRFSLDWKLNN